MENQKPKASPLMEEKVTYSFNLELPDIEHSGYKIIDFIKETLTFQEFVAKLYLFHQYCIETDRAYVITVCNSPSINPVIKALSNEIS